MKKTIQSLTVRAVFRLIVMVLVLLLTIPFVTFTLQESTDKTPLSESDEFYDMCMNQYESRNFGALYESLTTLNLSRKTYGLFWEIMEGYQDYSDCIAYKRVLDSGDESVRELYEEAYAKVLDRKEHYRYDANYNALAAFAQEVLQEN